MKLRPTLLVIMAGWLSVPLSDKRGRVGCYKLAA